MLCSVRLKIKVGQMSPTPAIASALGQRGVQIIKFLQDFNVLVKGEADGKGVIITADIFQDKSYKILVKGRPISDLLKESASLEKGSSEPGKSVVAQLTMDQIKDVAVAKQKYLKTKCLESMIKMVLGTAYSIGIKVVNN